MPEANPIEFTDREKYILSYYRAADVSGSSRVSLYDLAFLLASVVCMALFLSGGETAYSFVGYALLLGRLLYLVVEGGRWNRDFRSIFAKYDAQLKALHEARGTQHDRT
jgi:hypothetical protein